MLGLVLLACFCSAGFGSSLFRPSVNDVSTFYFALKHDPASVKRLQDTVHEVSNPMSSRFAQYLTKKQVLDMIAPPTKVSEGVVAHVRNTCREVGEISQIVNRRDIIKVTAKTSCVERLFGVRLMREKSRAGPLVLHPTSRRISVPLALKGAVEMVVGVVDQRSNNVSTRKKKLPRNVPHVATRQTPQGNYTFDYVWLGDVNRVYNVPSNEVKNPTRITQAVVEFISYSNGTYNGEGAPWISDLQLYQQYNNLPSFNNISTIVGPWVLATNPQLIDNGESALDVQMESLAQTPIVYITINNSWVFGMATELFSLASTPSVSSVSYGTDEIAQCDVGACHSHESVGQYITRCEVELAKLAAIGATVVVSSGDQGAVGRSNSDCSLDNTTSPLNPSYPGASAYVISVSATVIARDSSIPNIPPPAPICNFSFTCGLGMNEFPAMETDTALDWTTGGGFSQNIAQPVYQRDLVFQYLTDETISFPPAFTFNVNNRAFPDVSAFGGRILVLSNGTVQPTAGTSASAPLVASLIALINDARVSAGKSPIGFWNPLLYVMKVKCPACFNTILPGNNAMGEGAVCKYGFYTGAAPFNAVTGLGSLNVNNIIKFVLGLP